MLRMRCKQGGLFLTADLMVPDGQVGPSSDRRDVSATKKIQCFQPVEDLVTALDSIASGAVAT
jgi:hypothetical protein